MLMTKGQFIREFIDFAYLDNYISNDDWTILIKALKNFKDTQTFNQAEIKEVK